MFVAFFVINHRILVKLVNFLLVVNIATLIIVVDNVVIKIGNDTETNVRLRESIRYVKKL